MREQTYRRGDTGFTHLSVMYFVDKTATAPTTFVYRKYSSDFEIIWKYNKENIYYDWLLKGVFDLAFDS